MKCLISGLWSGEYIDFLIQSCREVPAKKALMEVTEKRGYPQDNSLTKAFLTNRINRSFSYNSIMPGSSMQKDPIIDIIYVEGLI